MHQSCMASSLPANSSGQWPAAGEPFGIVQIEVLTSLQSLEEPRFRDSRMLIIIYHDTLLRGELNCV